MEGDARTPDDRQWLLLLGAMLGNKAILTEAVKRLATEDVPESYRSMWSALKTQKTEAVKAAMASYGIQQNGEPSTTALIKHLQEKALENYVRSSVTRATMSGVLGADKAADFFERMAVNIRSRQEAMK